MLKWMTAGESHGAALTAIIEGIPSGVHITTGTLQNALARRRNGYGRGTRQKLEQDEVTILGGVRHGLTTGAPISVLIKNTEWSKWEHVMSSDPVDPHLLAIDVGTGDKRESSRNKILTRPRPGHADLAGMMSYGLRDSRDVLERASARETAARVAVGAIALQYLKELTGISILSRVNAIGDYQATYERHPPLPEDAAKLDASPVRTLDPQVETAFMSIIDDAHDQGDTVGGVIEVVAWNVPVGLGSHISASARLDARLASALMSIPSVKGVEIGDGFEQSRLPGSKAHDEIIYDTDGTITRRTNHAGGIEGGTSNGQPIVVRAAFKPISTVPHALRTVDMETGEKVSAFHQRSDTCQVVPGAVVSEAMVALTIASVLGEHAGGASLNEARRNLSAYMADINDRIPSCKGK